MDLKEIKQILKLMDEHELSEFTLERDDEKLVLRRGQSGDKQQHTIQMAPMPQLTIAPPTAAAPSPQPVEPDKAVKPDESLHVITSPIVGTFYAAPSPDSEPYVRSGQTVAPDTTVCIVEAMKIMNEIKAEVSGTIEQICVQNGQPVEFGQPLFRVRLS